MIGYYVHHVGLGHLNRATALAATLDDEVTGISSLPRPPGWAHDWLTLPRDDAAPSDDPTAGGRLHWAPLHHEGQRRRWAMLSTWIAERRPHLLVVDVSVEVALFARLHGVPVLSVVMPGERGDAAHRLGYGVSSALVGFWPPGAGSVVRGLPSEIRRRIHALGALSRFDATTAAHGVDPVPRRVAVLLGAGGHDLDADVLDAARRATKGWTWSVLDASTDDGSRDVAGSLARASVVVTHAGENALAEVASLRRPAIVIPQRRPHDEQHCTAAVLAAGRWPAVVAPRPPREGWRAMLEEVADLDTSAWSRWCDGRAAVRFADVVRDTCSRTPATTP